MSLIDRVREIAKRHGVEVPDPEVVQLVFEMWRDEGLIGRSFAWFDGKRFYRINPLTIRLTAEGYEFQVDGKEVKCHSNSIVSGDPRV